jgi:lipopolysaccharide/colanic/teichoic acid biosynthesis glycosyltransferase
MLITGGSARDAERSRAERLGDLTKRTLDVVVASMALVLVAPLTLCLAIVIKLESPGPVLYRCRRVGCHGRTFGMLKFRKMADGARGPALTLVDDDRFTRIGRFLAATKLDEIPQLWNVLRGEMSLVGPRPESPEFVALRPETFAITLQRRPGITGLSQLAYARENEILDPGDRVADYICRVLPQKLRLDQLYVAQTSFGRDLQILLWTMAAVVLRLDVAVHRETGRLNRRRPRAAAYGVAVDVGEAA